MRPISRRCQQIAQQLHAVLLFERQIYDAIELRAQGNAMLPVQAVKGVDQYRQILLQIEAAGA